jgi:hypothetical protein
MPPFILGERKPYFEAVLKTGYKGRKVTSTSSKINFTVKDNRVFFSLVQTLHRKLLLPKENLPASTSLKMKSNLLLT